MHKPKVILIIMDGWGYSPTKKGNAILEARTPNFDYLWKNYSHTLLNAFGENVGLPWGSIGSSEVGHTSIGSGRLVNQELTEIDKEINNGSFYQNEELLNFVEKVKSNEKPVHLIGLVSNGGVHSDMGHLYALLRLFKQNDIKKDVYIHVITDGRDTSPKSSIQYIKELTKKARRIRIKAHIATITGRYFAMDRDSRWDRTKKAYLAMTESIGNQGKDPVTAIEAQYKRGVTDEFIEPTIMHFREQRGSFLSALFIKKNREELERTKKIEEGDNILFFNIRPDRMRQIVEMFLFKKEQAKTEPVKNLNILTLATYDEFLPVRVAYPAKKIIDTLAKLLSDHNIRQGHFAETEKYAHVTYFFNGSVASPHPKESWHLVPSPKVKTYDQKPEMSARAVTNKVFEVVEKEKLDFVLINYANADMVGHTGNYKKVIKAVETVDIQLKLILDRFAPETTVMITADHGNAECMIHPETGEIDKKHSVNPVPFILVNPDFKKKEDIDRNQNLLNTGDSPTGILADICPTILFYFTIKKTENMTGVNLIDSL